MTGKASLSSGRRIPKATGGIERSVLRRSGEQGTSADGDLVAKQGAIYNKHCMHDHYSWEELNTVDVDVAGSTDVKNENTGLNRKHPKVYVGFFSHASFPEINTSRKTAFNGECPKMRDLLGNEY
ncbi:MAG: hypothetical protein Q9210_007319, partial [Variospora velana]